MTAADYTQEAIFILYTLFKERTPRMARDYWYLGESPKLRQPIKSLGVICTNYYLSLSDLWVNILQSGHSIAEWYLILFAYWPNEVHKQRQFVNLCVRQGFAELCSWE